MSPSQESKEAVYVSDEVQVREKKQKKDISMDETAERDALSPESLDFQELLKQRIEQVKRAFKPAGMLRHINSLDNNKGK